MHKFLKPCSGDICWWFKESGIADQIIRFWINDINGEDECFFGKIRHVITLPDGKTILGISMYDDDYEGNVYPAITYYNWDDLCIEWAQLDQDEVDGDTWQNHNETKLMS